MTSSTRTAAGRESPYRGFLPVVALEELPLVTAFLDATAFLAGGGGLAAIVFPTALPLGVAFLTTPRRDPDPPVFFATPVAPEGFGADEDLLRLLTTLRTPGPGTRLVSPPLSHRTVIRTPLTDVTTPDRGPPL